METPGYRVFVGGISWKADEIQLENFFSTHGQVLECKIIMDKATGKSKGYGFVTFKDADAAEFVKQTANFSFLGKNMNVGDAVRKTPEPNGANHNGSSRSIQGNYNNGYGYQSFYNPNYYRNDTTQFYGGYSPDGTFYPGPGYYYQGFRGNQGYQYGGMPNFQGSYPQNFEDQPSSPESPPNQQQSSYPQNGFNNQFPPNFNAYYYGNSPYYYQYNNGYAYGPGFNNGGFNENGENSGHPSDPSSAPLDGSLASQGKVDANVHTPVNTTTPPLPADQQQEAVHFDSAITQPASTAAISSSTSSGTVPPRTSTPDSTSTPSYSTSASSTSSSAFEQGSSTYTRAPSKGHANTGIASPKQGVQQQQQQQQQQRSSPASPKLQPQQIPKNKQHKAHRAAQDPLHNHVIAGLNKLSVSSN